MSYILTVPYTEYSIPASEAFPTRLMYSPMVKTVLEHNNTRGSFYFLSIADSGADNTVFPASFGERLGLDIENGKKMAAGGVGGGDIWYFHNVRVWVEIENEAWHFDCYAGFSRSMDNLGVGLLGRHGFFELFEEVTFDQRKRLFKLKVPGERSQQPPQNSRT